MLGCIIMRFINRIDEMARLEALTARGEGGLAVVYGRRRVGKTRLLLEWSDRHGGLYTVADQSAAEVQRRYFAGAVADRLPGFADVDYPDWPSLLARLAREARSESWRGPIVFDELPYLVTSSPELPSSLQRWIDHDAKEARLIVAVAGSSQRMMQGLALDGNAPLYGRAQVILDLQPIASHYLNEVFGELSGIDLVEHYTAWGGIPRYWELAAELAGDLPSGIENLVLDPLGPLHQEADRLLIEELPPALETRPVLDAIGAGVHRLSEIAGRLGRPATSMSRPLDRLMGMGLVRREVPFGESEKKSRRSLYKIDDPFFRLWFRLVAPHRGRLASAERETRLTLLDRSWDLLAAQAWEELCRARLPFLAPSSELSRSGPWWPGKRWWRGNSPEWDVAAESVEGRRLILGEVKWSRKPFAGKALERALGETAAKTAPTLGKRFARHEIERVLFVPEIAESPPEAGVTVVTAEELMSSQC